MVKGNFILGNVLYTFLSQLVLCYGIVYLNEWPYQKDIFLNTSFLFFFYKEGAWFGVEWVGRMQDNSFKALENYFPHFRPV